MVYFCAPTYNHSTESHTCKFFPFQSDVKAKDKYKWWIPPIRLVTVFIENLSFWKQRKIQQFWADALFSSTRNLAEIYDRPMRAVACGVYRWFMIAFVLCIMVFFLFFFFIFITLYCEPELGLNRTVTVTAYICFHHAWAEILEAVNSYVPCVEEEIKGPASTPECVAAILEMVKSRMAQRYLNETKTNNIIFRAKGIS